MVTILPNLADDVLWLVGVMMISSDAGREMRSFLSAFVAPRCVAPVTVNSRLLMLPPLSLAVAPLPALHETKKPGNMVSWFCGFMVLWDFE